jgi:hypothetical protein
LTVICDFWRLKIPKELIAFLIKSLLRFLDGYMQILVDSMVNIFIQYNIMLGTAHAGSEMGRTFNMFCLIFFSVCQLPLKHTPLIQPCTADIVKQSQRFYTIRSPSMLCILLGIKRVQTLVSTVETHEPPAPLERGGGRRGAKIHPPSIVV